MDVSRAQVLQSRRGDLLGLRASLLPLSLPLCRRDLAGEQQMAPEWQNAAAGRRPAPSKVGARLERGADREPPPGVSGVAARRRRSPTDSGRSTALDARFASHARGDSSGRLLRMYGLAAPPKDQPWIGMGCNRVVGVQSFSEASLAGLTKRLDRAHRVYASRSPGGLRRPCPR